MKKTINFVMTLLVICSTFAISSCSKKDSKVELQDIDRVSIENALVWYNTNNNMVNKIRFTVYNHSPKTLYYIKFRTYIYRSETNSIIWSDVYEAGSKTNMNEWKVAPEDTQNTDYYEVDFYLVDWYFKTEILDARFIE